MSSARPHHLGGTATRLVSVAMPLLLLVGIGIVSLGDEVDALPHFLLQGECAKGIALIDRTGPLPAIMTAVPDVDPSLLAISRAQPAQDTDTLMQTLSSFFAQDVRMPAVTRDEVVEGGARLELVYNGSYAGHATHIAFVVDSGAIQGSVPCGHRGARMVCTTCGDDEAWLKRTVWTLPTTPGPATAAVAVGHSGLGTPAVRLARFTINVKQPEAT